MSDLEGLWKDGGGKSRKIVRLRMSFASIIMIASQAKIESLRFHSLSKQEFLVTQTKDRTDCRVWLQTLAANILISAVLRTSF